MLSTRPPSQKIDTHQPDLRAAQVARVKTLHIRHVAVRSPWWTDNYEILTLHPTDGSSGRVTCVTPFPFSVSVFKHIKAALISPLNHQLSRHSSTMRMSGLTSVSTLFAISALAGSIYLAEVSMIQQLMYLEFIICFKHVPSLFSGSSARRPVLWTHKIWIHSCYT